MSRFFVRDLWRMKKNWKSVELPKNNVDSFCKSVYFWTWVNERKELIEIFINSNSCMPMCVGFKWHSAEDYCL